MTVFAKKNKNKIILIICIILHTLLLFKICDFRKAMETYGDELAYYNMAHSLFYGKGLKVHGVPFEFQNLAYCYFLLPFLNISNSVLRMHIITMANAFCMSLSVIPVWLICREIKLNNRYKWFVAVLIMVWPDMLTAGTMMSENLYWPLSLTALYFCVKSILSDKKTNAFLAAVFCYLAYFCKEVGVCLALAYVAFFIFYPVLGKILNMGHNGQCQLDVKKIVKNIDWIKLAVFTVSYAACYLLFKIILFADIHNLYSVKMDASFFRDIYSVMYFIYGFIYYVIASVIAFLVYPMLYPVIHYKKISREAQKIFLFAWILLVGTIIVIVFTITVKEDLGAVTPRIHLRYFSSLVGLFFPVMFRVFSDMELDERKVAKTRKTEGVFWIVFLGICVLVFKGVSGGCANEHLGLFFSQFLTKRMGTLCIDKNPSMIFYPSAIIVIIVMGIMLAAGYFFQHFGRIKKLFSTYIFAVMVFVSSVNSGLGLRNLYSLYVVEESPVVEMRVINDYFKNPLLKDKNVMCICENRYSKNAKIYDTYFDGANNLEIHYKTFMDKMFESGGECVKVSQMQLNEIFWGTNYYIDTLDYLILCEPLSDLDSVISGLEIVSEISGENFVVYQNMTPEKLQFQFPTEEYLAEVCFMEEGYNAFWFVESGISNCQGDYSWTDGNELIMRVRCPDTIDFVNVEFQLSEVYHSEQRVSVYQDEAMIYEDVISGEDGFSFLAKPNHGDCSFRVYLPDAVSPSSLGKSADERKIALALRNIIVTKADGSK